MAGKPLQVLLTGHKGVDLHAATARRVMRERLTGGARLADLRRCEFHVFGGPLAPAGLAVPGLADLLGTGRYYNPNKHRYGHFELATTFRWADGDGGALPAGWPGEPRAGDLQPGATLYDELLGGPAATGQVAVDVVAWARGQTGAVVSGTLWRLVLTGDEATAETAACGLAVARGGREGLLVNPHMECWLISVARTDS